MTWIKLSEKSLLELMELDKNFQIETRILEKKLRKRTKEREDLIRSFWITIQNFYYRKKAYLKKLEK